jgi:hypothetical protein
VIVDLIQMLQPLSIDQDGSIGAAGKDRVRALLAVYSKNGGLYDRQYGVNPRCILVLHTSFMESVYDETRPFMLKKMNLKMFGCATGCNGIQKT